MRLLFILLILVFTVSKVATATEARKVTYGVCKLFLANVSEQDNANDSSVNSLHPITYVIQILSNDMKEKLSLPSGAHLPREAVAWLEKTGSFSKTVLFAPRHGRFVNMRNNPHNEYLPNRGYLGKDQIDLLIEGEDDQGRPFSMKIRYYINVLPMQEINKAIVNDQAYVRALQRYCGKNQESWLIPNGKSTNDQKG